MLFERFFQLCFRRSPLTSSYLYGNVYGTAGTSTLYAMGIQDVISGNNGRYFAGADWDRVTGLGSPDVYNLILGKWAEQG